jgi:PEP-CTERM motif
MVKRYRALRLSIAMVALIFVCRAYADSIDITLMQPTESGASGSTLTFDVSLTNLTSSTIFLNGAAATTSSSSLVMNDNPFLTNAPISLAAGASSGPFAASTVFISPGTPPGSFSANTFSVLGGSQTSFDVIGSTGFSVQVSADPSPAPEPGSLVLLGSGVLGIGLKSLVQRNR